jgi:hypothetical protein
MSQTIAEKAYQATKADGDPDWGGLNLTFKDELLTRVDGVIRTGITQTPFERKVKELYEAEQGKGDAPLKVDETPGVGKQPMDLQHDLKRTDKPKAKKAAAAKKAK